MTSNIILDNGLILTCYRMDVGAVLIKVWGRKGRSSKLTSPTTAMA